MSTRFPSKVDVAEDDRETLVNLLNTGLANSLDLYSQVKQAHWNVRGMFFYSRHEMFDEIAAHLEDHADSIAERAGILGGYAEGTVRMAADASALPEYNDDAVQAKQHLSILREHYGIHAEWLRDAIETAEEIGDVATEDLLTETLREIEFDLWFIESHLEG